MTAKPDANSLDILSANTIIGGRFRVERTLGAGGMGRVVLARHIELDQSVAIKLLLPELAAQEEYVTRMLREARAAARLTSEHVIKIFDVTATGEFAPYIVMEFLEGESVGERLLREGRLPVAVAADFVIQACEAIAEAHRLGIVHRDLKPENLFITPKPGRSNFVKVLDFGISRVDAPDAHQITRSQAMLGSPAYASPEQLRSSRSAGPPTDIWALGVILYECATGSLPFSGDTLAEVCTQILLQAPAPPRSLQPEVSDEFQAIILGCLSKESERRFATVHELVRRLAPFAPDAARDFFAHCGAATDVGTANPTTLVAVDSRAVRRKRDRLLLGVSAGIALLSVAAISVHRFRAANNSVAAETAAVQSSIQREPASILEQRPRSDLARVPLADSSVRRRTERDDALDGGTAAPVPAAALPTPPTFSQEPAQSRHERIPRVPAKPNKPINAKPQANPSQPWVDTR